MCDYCKEKHQTSQHICGVCGVVGKHAESAHRTFKTIWELVEIVDLDNVEGLSNDLALFLFYVANLKSKGNLTDIKEMGRFRWIDDGRNDVVIRTEEGYLIKEIINSD